MLCEESRHIKDSLKTAATSGTCCCPHLFKPLRMDIKKKEITFKQFPRGKNANTVEREAEV